ncbi:MAG TPA: hypothetical protein VN428_13845 [Bryobacteraceae bacterium]|nr:hypothetical protein [Bryobacteraceae bacterium]
MPDSSSAAQRAPTSPYYRWEVPGKPVSILLSEEVSDHVLVEGMRGLGLMPRRGAEVGGLLLGHVEPGSPSVVVVDQAVPVECEYASGPSWTLSQRDRIGLRAAIAEHANRASSPVGFYRTDTREQLAFSAADLELFREFFAEPDSVALIVKPRVMQSSVAGFFIWESEAVSETSPLEFRVQPRQALTRRAVAFGAETPVAQPEHTAFDDIPLPGFLGVPEAPARFGFRLPAWSSWWIRGPLLAALLAAGGFLGYVLAQRFAEKSPISSEPRNPYALSLVVLEYGDNLHLSWDREALAVASAARGTLTIVDGDRIRTLDLSAAQLHDGSVIYRRLTPDVRLKLEVFLSEKSSVAESWRLVTQTGQTLTKIGP